MVFEEARAKTNLGLAVLGQRPDGYHELHTVFATLDLADRIRIEPRGEGIHLEVKGGKLPPGRENLAYRAALLYLRAAGLSRGVQIVLEKQIPVAAGLGGGSADAAAVLRGLERLFGAGVDLFALAKTLGADVPFLLRGGLAEARGVGEALRFLPPKELFFVLLNPGIEVPTALVYRELTPRDFGPELAVEEILSALARGEPPPWRNDLEAPAFRLFPELQRLKEELEAEGLYPLLSGSGATFLIPASGPEAAEALGKRLSLRYPDAWVRAVQTA